MSNTMAKLKETTKIVKHILERDPRTRNSDSFLYLKVLEYVSAKDKYCFRDMTVAHFLENMADYNVPGFETVRRTRQKMQHDYPELRANAVVNDHRLANEEAYREYAQGVY